MRRIRQKTLRDGRVLTWILVTEYDPATTDSHRWETEGTIDGDDIPDAVLNQLLISG